MKYIGSKAKISQDIVKIIHEIIERQNIGIYVEPFVGGFNVIDKVKCNKRVANDIDNIPIDLVQGCLSGDFDLSLLTDIPTKPHFYNVRDNPDVYEKAYRSAILLFGSYNARVYGGCYGAFAKTKQGTIRNYFQEAKRNFEKQLPNLVEIELHNKDYKELNYTNALIYCDIPYKNSIGYKHSFNHDEFYEWCKEQKNKGNTLLISEYEMPETWFECVWEKEVKTHLNNRNKISKTEKLFMVKE